MVVIDRTKYNADRLSSRAWCRPDLSNGKRAIAAFYSAVPARAPDSAHIGMMEYTIASQNARLLGSPAVSAVYVSGGEVAILGSNRLTARVMTHNPNLLVPAEIAWIRSAAIAIERGPDRILDHGSGTAKRRVALLGAKAVTRDELPNTGPKRGIHRAVVGLERFENRRYTRHWPGRPSDAVELVARRHQTRRPRGHPGPSDAGDCRGPTVKRAALILSLPSPGTLR